VPTRSTQGSGAHTEYPPPRGPRRIHRYTINKQSTNNIRLALRAGAAAGAGAGVPARGGLPVRAAGLAGYQTQGKEGDGAGRA